MEVSLSLLPKWGMGFGFTKIIFSTILMAGEILAVGKQQQDFGFGENGWGDFGGGKTSREIFDKSSKKLLGPHNSSKMLRFRVVDGKLTKMMFTKYTGVKIN